MKKHITANDRHRHMVDDPLRTLPLLKAVVRAVRPGDRVLDIGTGLGILAIAAAQAGAGHVVACDCDAAALAAARRAARAAGVEKRITFLRQLSFDLKLRSRVDVVLCETVGSFAFDENILATIADAKKRLLRRGGRIVLARVELWGAPCRVLPKRRAPAKIARVDPQDLVGPPTKFGAVSFAKTSPSAFSATRTFSCLETATVRAVVVWPRVMWDDRNLTDASPFGHATHWKQGICPVEPRNVEKGERVSLDMILQPHPEDPRTMTERLWRWSDAKQ